MKKYAFGVDIGGTTIKIGLFETSGNLIEKWEIPTRTQENGTYILNDIAEAIAAKLAEKNISEKEIEGIGVGVPGPVGDDGTVYKCVNLGWSVFNVAIELERKTGFKVKVGNDANVAALGEMWQGGGKGYKNLVMVTLGTGVGGGIIIDGKIYSGSNFAGAEIGHTVIEVDGPQCACGRKGCFEVFSSATGLIRMTKEAMEADKDSVMHKITAERKGKVTARTSFDAMRMGDKTAKAVVDKYIKYLAAGITNTINIFQPDILCIGGGVCNEGDPLLLPVKELVKQEVYTKNSPKNTEIVIAKLGNDAGIIGAAFLGNAK